MKLKKLKNQLQTSALAGVGCAVSAVLLSGVSYTVYKLGTDADPNSGLSTLGIGIAMTPFLVIGFACFVFACQLAYRRLKK